MEWLNQIPSWLSFLSIIALQAGGFVAIYGVFDSKYRERQKEKDAQEDRIIELYKTEVGALKEKLQTYDTDLKLMRNELSRIGGENKLLRDLVTGQDKDTMAWRGRTEEAMNLIQEIGKLAVANGKKMDAALEGIKTSSANVERLASSIEKHLELQDTRARKA